LDEEEVEEEQPTEGGNGSNRNFLLALGILGGIFILLIIALTVLFLSRPRNRTTADINATNAVIMTANAATASAATEVALTQSAPTLTPTVTITPLPSATALLAIASPTATVGKGDVTTATVSAATSAAQTAAATDRNAATVAALLTQQAPTFVVQTQAAQGVKTNTPAVVIGKGTATVLPTTGFADEVGLPGLFGLALGLVVLIVVVRRLRLQPSR
jgi:hypothetical protein